MVMFLPKSTNGVVPLAANANDTLAKVWFSLQFLQAEVDWLFSNHHSDQIAVINNLGEEVDFRS